MDIATCMDSRVGITTRKEDEREQSERHRERTLGLSPAAHAWLAMGCRSIAACRCSSVWRSEEVRWQAGAPTSSAHAGRRAFEKARADGTFGKARAKRRFGKVP